MAGEIQVSFSTGFTLYALIRSSTGTIWNGSALEAYATANYATYDVALTEQGTASAFYVGTFPATAAAGIYSVVAKQQAGGSPAESDKTVAEGIIHWDGSASMPLSDVATSGQVGRHFPTRIFRQQMVPKFPFKMVSSANHISPFTSGALNASGGISGQLSKDGGAFGLLSSGDITEYGLGHYHLVLTSGDTDADVLTIVLTAPGADQRDISILTQPVSGVLTA